MNRKELINKIKEFIATNNYNPSHLVLSHGGACVMHGIRNDTNDVDMYVSRRIWDDQIRKGRVPVKKQDGIESIQATKDISIRVGVGFMSRTVENEMGVLYQSLEQTRREYMVLDRPKDKAIMKILNDMTR